MEYRNLYILTYSFQGYGNWENAISMSWLGMCVKSLQSCPTPCNPVESSPSGLSVHGILQARILEGLPCPPPGDLPLSGIESMSHVSCIGRQVLYL